MLFKVTIFFFGRFMLFGGFLVSGFWFCLTVLFYANCCWPQRILPTGLHDSFAILTRKGAENYHALRLPAPFFYTVVTLSTVDAQV